MDYEFVTYETGSDGVATITLNRPPVNAFNRQMSGELVLALDRFAHAEDERVLILTGAGRVFSTGEDLKNINLVASDFQMQKYAREALRDYHNIVRAILRTGKPIVAMLNGVAAGAGMSIALACDYRYAENSKSFVPAFESMGLIPDSGMILTLTRLKEKSTILKYPTVLDAFVESLAQASPLAYALSKEIRNKALLQELNENVFPWEIRAQTACLQSDYFKQKARAFLGKQKEAKEVMSHGRKA